MNLPSTGLRSSPGAHLLSTSNDDLVRPLLVRPDKLELQMLLQNPGQPAEHQTTVLCGLAMPRRLAPSALTAEEHDRQLTQPITTWEPGCPDLHPRSSRRSIRPWMRHHIKGLTVLSRVSCRPFHLNVDRFHQPCLLPGRTSRIGEDCRPRITWRPLTFCGQPGSSSSRLTGSFCHADWTVPRQDVNSPFPPCVCHPGTKGCLHTRRFGILASPPPPVGHLPWGTPYPWRCPS